MQTHTLNFPRLHSLFSRWQVEMEIGGGLVWNSWEVCLTQQIGLQQMICKDRVETQRSLTRGLAAGSQIILEEFQTKAVSNFFIFFSPLCKIFRGRRRTADEETLSAERSATASFVGCE